MKKAMNKKGFTLVEIMIVVAIIGLLAAIGIPSFQKARANTMQKSAINNARLVISAVDQYAMEEGLDQGVAVAQADYIVYLKGCEDGTVTALNVGAIGVSVVDTVTGEETAKDLAEDLYPSIFD